MHAWASARTASLLRLGGAGAMLLALVMGPIGIASMGAAEPTPASPVPIQFVTCRHTGYQFDGSGRVTGTKAATLTHPSSARAIARRTIRGQVYLHVLNGI